MSKLWRRIGLILAIAVTPGIPGSAPSGMGERQAPAAPIAAITDAPDAATASEAAKRQRSAVVVNDMTTETRLVAAQPDGALTAELSVVPKRTARDGRWVDIDTTLVRRADGTIGPKATTIDMAFSGGGSKQPLVALRVAGGHVELSWPGVLPPPVLSGSVVTYPEVLPGVDLTLRAEAAGYVKHFVVRTAEAARNPALAQLRLGVRSHLLSLATTPSGGTEVRDAAGQVILTGPPLLMWDDAKSTTDGPGEGAVVAPVGLSMDKENLYLVPDEKLLKDPKTRFPVVIDPGQHEAGRHHWTKVFKGKPTARNWDGGGIDGGEGKVGYCGWAGCDGIGEVRTYWLYDTSFLWGRTVLASRFKVHMDSGPDCNAPRNHALFQANHAIVPETDWNNQPNARHHLHTVSVPGCQPGYVTWNPGTYVDAGTSTYFLGAETEGDKNTWRKYNANSAMLWVEFNLPPSIPGDVRLSPALPAPCRWCDGVPYIRADGITLQAYHADPDGDRVTADWFVKDTAGESWLSNASDQASGTWHNYYLALGDRDQRTITRWAARGRDAYAGGHGGWRDGPGPFAVDRIGVPATNPPKVEATIYPDDNRWHGGVGVFGRFTFKPNGVSDIDHYRYGWSDPPREKVDAERLGGDATVTLAPDRDGPRDLYVQSFDRAGNPSTVTVHRFYVRAGNGPLAQWSFEGNTKDTAFLGWRDATGTGSYAPGAVGTGIGLDRTKRLTAAGNIRTDDSFSVTAWVRIDRLDAGEAEVIRQDGTNMCGFCLHYEHWNQAWVFVAPFDDSPSPSGYHFVKSPAPPIAGEWTHLAGVYDAEAAQMRLYVNGVQVGATARTARWNAEGPLRMGGFPGMLDEVKVYDRAITTAEVRAQVGHDNVQLGYWKFDDELTSRTALNAVPGGAAGVLNGGAKFVKGEVAGAVQLNGDADFVSTGTPVIRTDQSFTVAAWLKVDKAAPAQHGYAAVSQDGTVNSGFSLGYRQLADGGTWELYVPSADQHTPRPADTPVRSAPGSAVVGEAAHVAGVYDAATRQLRLFVNGRPAGTVSRPSAFPATGELRVGGAIFDSVRKNPWFGTVDEVRAYNRALSAEELQGLVSRDAVAKARWAFDGNLVADPVDFNGVDDGHRVDYIGGQSNLPAPGDMAIKLNGSNYVTAPHALKTDGSFAVSAWARLDRIGGHPSVIAQDGATRSVFRLQANPEGKWVFALDRAVVGPAVQTGAWTHLAGSYNAVSKRAELYVNGVLVGSLDDVTGVDFPEGKLQIGATFVGAIDDAAVWSRPLFADEVKVMAGRDLTLAHHWRLDEPGGRNVFDSVGSRSGGLSADAKFVPGRSGNAIGFDGRDDAVAIPGVDVRTDQAFTVAAWVQVPAGYCDLSSVFECRTEAVSIDGKFRMGHLMDNDSSSWGAWYVEMPEPDGTVTKASVAAAPYDFDRWVHLTGVYDPATKIVVLYVDAVRHDEGTLNTAWNKTTGLNFGKSLTGNVDDVRVYTGALDHLRIKTLWESYPAPDGPADVPPADAGHWKFDESTGTTLADSSGNNRTATIKGGHSWVGGRTGHGVLFDGTTGYAETTGPALNTERDFTAAAWVYPTTTDSVNRMVVGQDGNRVSVFQIVYVAATRRWAAVVSEADRDDTPLVVLQSGEPVAVGEWVHVALTYKADLGQLRLYVNGVLAAARAEVKVLPSSGPVSMGRSKANGVPAGHWARGVDEVRLYQQTLSAGQIRRIHDEAPPVDFQYHRFDDGTTRDFSWRKNDATPAGTVAYAPGISGQALQLSGTGEAVSAYRGVHPTGSFTVSAFVKLSRNDRVSTILSQDGDRNSGFVLQYRPGLDRWVFGQATSDSDGAPLVYAHSLLPPTLNQWTHVAGVYDYPARQLRLYIDGKLAGTRDNVAMWQFKGKFVLGRAKENGASTGHFHGLIDEAHAALGVIGEAALAQRAGWPQPPADQLGRFINTAGERYTDSTSAKPRPGYRFHAALGMPAPEGPDTVMLRLCQSGADHFTATACGSATHVYDIGRVYTTPPASTPTVPLYQCTTGTDRFDSRDANCLGATKLGVLGHIVAYAALARYYLPAQDHFTTIHDTPPTYRYEARHGYLGLTQPAGTVWLYSCTDAGDQFVSLDPACEGKTLISQLGTLWSQPPAGKPSTPLYRCLINGQRFTSPRADCGGFTPDGLLGHILTELSA
ncbi:LamG domain-containing protein [Allorhizocola rhizosphaerae]|uniref:LamG domain-containing protein n=1 Tax=Allorhizocola rhizosphaerae TaxID=1872709 RepID=UPI0013C2B764|nr:LamG domain-containing protein [Allorhizocola rhizosphaerae]